jgi:hypothetical protein
MPDLPLAALPEKTEKIDTPLLSVPATVPPPTPPPAPPPTGGGARRRWAIGLGALGVVAMLAVAAVMLPALWQRTPEPGPAVATVEIGIAYGTEKQGWFQDAVAAFAATPGGQHVKINLIPMGSLEGGQAVARREDPRIHVWSPASSLYKSAFVRDWQSKHSGRSPILKEESLCMTPLVFVFWKERHDAYVAKYKTITFPSITQAMQTPQGWGEIAGRPEWGRFHFGMTNPTQSNSGLMALLLMACELNQDRAVTLSDVAAADFRSEVKTIKRGLAGTSNSTGNLMKDMVTKGPGAFDAVLIYENLAIDYLKAAQGRWGELQVAYPRRNLWSDNPYYILDVPWSTPEQQQAAEKFLQFLLQEPMQHKALAHGFRPANIHIPLRDHPDSPFVRLQERGLAVNVAANCEPVGPDVIDALLALWEQSK